MSHLLSHFFSSWVLSNDSNIYALQSETNKQTVKGGRVGRGCVEGWGEEKQGDKE